MSASVVLVVEDDPPLRTLTARALKENGYVVRQASAAPEMWIAFDAGDIDLIILDIMLPGTSGIDLCRQIRRRSDVPIIFVSAKGGETDRVVGLELGADDYLSKPFGTRELLARVRAVLRRGGMASSEQSTTRHVEARFGGWTVSLSRRELISPTGALVDLTGAEFDLLVTFLNNPQRVIGRERLIEMSRTRLGDSSDRSIDVLVSRLRKKLSQPGDDTPIATVRGVGYMLKPEVSHV